MGRVRAANGCGDGVESGGGLIVEAVHEVAVSVDGDLDGGVAEPGLIVVGTMGGIIWFWMIVPPIVAVIALWFGVARGGLAQVMQ